MAPDAKKKKKNLVSRKVENAERLKRAGSCDLEG